jgi:hypothetical protein
MKPIYLLPLLCVLPAVLLVAAEPPLPPAQPSDWRPYPELPTVLYYEGFERGNVIFEKALVVEKGVVPPAAPPAAPAKAPEKAPAAAPAAPAAAPPGAPAANAGKAADKKDEKKDEKKDDKPAIAEQDPLYPSAHALKLGANEGAANDKVVYTQAKVVNTKLRIPSGLNPAGVSIQFFMWNEDSGEITVKLSCIRGDVEKKVVISKFKAWQPVTVKLDQFTGNKKPLEKNNVVNTIEISFKPKLRDKLPAVFIDDFVVTLGAHPMEVMPRLAQIERKLGAVLHSVERDGYNFPLGMQDKLRGIVAKSRAAKKAKVVLVVGATGPETTELCKELTAAQAKPKDSGYDFIAAADPGGAAIGGMDDMRQLLLYNLQKTGAEAVLLFFSTSDGAVPAPAANTVRLLLERTVNTGTVPLICVPGGDEKTTPGLFTKSAAQYATEFGAPWMDCNFALKEVAGGGGLEGSKFTAAGSAAVAAVAVNAIKSMHFAMTGRE